MPIHYSNQFMWKFRLLFEIQKWEIFDLFKNEKDLQLLLKSFRDILGECLRKIWNMFRLKCHKIIANVRSFFLFLLVVCSIGKLLHLKLESFYIYWSLCYQHSKIIPNDNKHLQGKYKDACNNNILKLLLITMLIFIDHLFFELFLFHYNVFKSVLIYLIANCRIEVEICFYDPNKTIIT